MKPPSIALFEKVFFASLLVGIVNTALSWQLVTAAADNPVYRQAGIGQGVIASGLILGLLLPLLLWYFIARRASTVAKWIYVVLTAFGVLGFVQALANPATPKGLTLVLSALALALQLFAAWLLFKPDAKAWFETRGVDPDRPDPHG